MASPRLPPVRVVSSLAAADFDCVVFVSAPSCDAASPAALLPASVQDVIKRSEGDAERLILVYDSSVAVGPVVVSKTGPLSRDFDDVRRFGDASQAGIERAIKAGLRRPLLVCPEKVTCEGYEHVTLVAILGAFQAAYTPLEVIEASSNGKQKISVLGLLTNDVRGAEGVVEMARAVECGRTVARDIAGSDPERMAAPKIEEYLREQFKGTKISLEVISDRGVLEAEYPCFAAVDRASSHVPRHRGRVIWMEYDGGHVANTVFLIGKGITYDTGGADIKVGGSMAGMHRDKGGAAAVAGIMKTLDILKPEGIKVVAGLAVCRNSVGADAYVADELIRCRAGQRLRIRNTDAEGRMAMVDLLCQAKERALSCPGPFLMTVATLTYHASLACGAAYSAILENGPAKQKGSAASVARVGDAVGDPFEVSTIRREDYAATKGASEYEDLHHSPLYASGQTPRGHQIPAAFLIMASGLANHGLDSTHPLPFVHIDMLGPAGMYPNTPTGRPLPALVTFLLSLGGRPLPGSVSVASSVVTETPIFDEVAVKVQSSNVTSQNRPLMKRDIIETSVMDSLKVEGERQMQKMLLMQAEDKLGELAARTGLQYDAPGPVRVTSGKPVNVAVVAPLKVIAEPEVDFVKGVSPLPVSKVAGRRHVVRHGRKSSSGVSESETVAEPGAATQNGPENGAVTATPPPADARKSTSKDAVAAYHVKPSPTKDAKPHQIHAHPTNKYPIHQPMKK